ncbi:MAG TPA: hypothetical protein VHF08_01845, partial [Nitrososphaeraceae archaeon]|nr:hypothetical protein [Nitrososphaeraceae archaeon]
SLNLEESKRLDITIRNLSLGVGALDDNHALPLQRINAYQPPSPLYIMILLMLTNENDMFMVGKLLIDGYVPLFHSQRLLLFYHFYNICLYIFAKIMLVE